MFAVSRKSQAHHQFNQRSPKPGPVSAPRHMDLSLRRTPSEVRTPKRPGMASPAPLSAARPIATNSRVKDKEDRVRTAYLAFAREALQNKANGDDARYNEMLEQFDLKRITPDAPSPTPQLRLWLLALSHVVSRLDKQYTALVQAIVDLPWATMDSAFVQSYTNFIGILVSARPEYLTLILAKVARGFTHQSGLQALDASGPEGSSNPLTRKDVYDRLHVLLEHLLELVPTLPTVLEPLLSKNFPHKRQAHAAHVTYIRNLLRMSTYCPHLAEKILSLIIERAIQIDVEIQIELDDLEELVAERGQVTGEVFELDPFEGVVGQDDAADSDDDGGSDDGDDNFSDLSSEVASVDEDADPKEPPGMDVPHIQEMVAKLDAVLTLLFEHFSRIDAPSAALRSGTPSTPTTPAPAREPSPGALARARLARHAQFQVLLGIFERTILRTFKSRYTQFLVFWAASRDAECCDELQGMLVQRALLDGARPAVERAAAAAYLASLVSRAAFVARDAARDVVALLCRYLSAHLDLADGYVRGGLPLPAAQHGVFFAAAQAVFLIFCFRWRDLLERSDDDEEAGADAPPPPGAKWMPELLVLQRAVTSPLNPLKVCSPNVAGQFARVAHTVHFLYCHSLLEANRRAEFGGVPLHAELTAFFPFDPYHLPRSAPYIRDVYRDWAAVAIGGEDDDDDNEEEEEEEEEEGEKGGEGMEDEAGCELGTSFGGMSISPMRPAVLV